MKRPIHADRHPLADLRAELEWWTPSCDYAMGRERLTAAKTLGLSEMAAAMLPIAVLSDMLARARR